MSSNTKNHAKTMEVFSDEHHQGMMLSWRIQQGLKNGVPLDRIWKYVNWFWKSFLSDHLALEEELLYPILPSENENVKKMIAQHKRLRRLFEDSPKDMKTLNRIDEELERHIRTEKKNILDEIDKYITKEQLLRIQKIHSMHQTLKWKDEFWESK